MTKIAPLSRRFLALLIDYLVIVAYGLALFGCTILFYNIVFGGIPNVMEMVGRAGSQLIGFTTLTLPIALYLYLTESSKRHATFGKRAMKLQVSSINKQPLARRQILLRTIVKLLPWEFAHTLVYQVVYYSQGGNTPPSWVMIGLIIANVLPLIYVLMIIITKNHRGPHDLAAQTVVVRLTE